MQTRPGTKRPSQIHASAQPTSHANRKGLARMPAIENLATAVCFHRTKPGVPSWRKHLSVSSTTRNSTNKNSYREFSNEGRASSPNLPATENLRLVQFETNVNTFDSTAVTSEGPCSEIANSHTTSPTRSCRPAKGRSSSPESNVAKSRSTPTASLHSESTSASELSYLRPSPLFTSLRNSCNAHQRGGSSASERAVNNPHDSTSSIQRTPPSTVRRQPDGPPKETTTTSSSASRTSLSPSPRRTHAIVHGQWKPLHLRCGIYGPEHDLPKRSGPTTRCSDETIDVGARPLLHTMKGLPFDLRRSEAEASRLMDVSV